MHHDTVGALAPTHCAIDFNVDFRDYEVHLNASWSPFLCMYQTQTQMAARNSAPVSDTNTRRVFVM